MTSIARMAKRTSEQFFGSMLKLEDLAECIMLNDLNGFMIELEDPTGEYVRWINFGVIDIPITISYLNGTPFLRGRYKHRHRTVNIHPAGDDEENVLFSVSITAPPRFKHPAAALAGPAAMEKKMSLAQQQQIEVAKLKHKTGLAVYRINRSPLPATGKSDAYDLHIVRANQPTMFFLDMRAEKTCCSVFLNWLGLTFHNTQYACYRKDQYIGAVYPKVGCGYDYAYVVKFEEVPEPAHVTKTAVLASAIAMLLNFGPINITDDISEEP